MELRELTEPKTRKVLAIFSGGFHPFHAGHASVYQYLRKKFPTADVYVASSNKTTERPFAFKDKQFLASQAGIPSDRFVEVASPYKAMEITQNYNPNDTVLIFALSEKDKERLGKPLKKDGTPSYFQPFPGSVEKCQPFAKHGYYVVTPTIKFSVLGSNISSASQIREMYKTSDDQTRLDIAEDLYPNSNQIQTIKKILDSVLASQPVTESKIFPPRPIDDNGWVTPDGKFIRVKPHHHMDAIRIYGMRGYGDAYDKGWIRIEIDPNNHTGYIQTDEDFGQCKNSILRIIKRMEQDVFRIIVYTGEGSFEWNGSDLIKLSNKMYEHIVKLKNGKYRLLSHKGKNLGTFSSHSAAAKHEGEVEYFKSLKESPASKSISKIVQGWILPDGKNLPLLKNLTHHKILNKFGMRDYYEAYNKGWIRVSIMELQSHDIVCLETTFPFKKVEDRLEKIARKIISQGKYNDFIAYCGSGNTYGRYDWDNGEFVKILPRRAFNESPDFGYSSFCNRDEELNQLKWSAKNLLPTGESVGIYARTPDSSSQTWVARMGLQIEEENGKPFRATIRQTTITPEWTGTGLGQILYDHAIQYAKKRGCKFFCSDIQRTMDAEGAWKRLARRYPVEKHSNYYIIDLSKV